MNNLSTLQKALFTIKKLKHALSQYESRPIAIVGMGCRFPQAKNKDEYWRILARGKNVITPIPDKRWSLLNNTPEIPLRDVHDPYWGSYLENIDEFDAYFFGISPREAIRMDPQQRILLEVAYEALEDAGLTLRQIAGSKMGVFLGMFASQFFYLQKLENELDALYIPTGNAMSIAANRISYVFDLRGPSLTVDTACSASLVAMQLACLNLQNKLCDTALVCGANINLLPSITHTLSKAKMLSPDGQCKTFDASADGYVRGEGVGVIVLKLLDRALQDNDRIYAVIAGTSINQDGATNGLTAPNGLQQELLLRTACESAQIDPNQISYVECHGTGTFLGDPIEIESLGNVISQKRTAENPCWIGSVKTNMGHLETAAGIASIIKTALSMQHGKILPHLNFHTPNPYISFNQYNFKIPQQIEDWHSYGDSRIAGISSFGFGGTNTHVLLRELKKEEQNFAAQEEESGIQRGELFTLSAKEAQTLEELVHKWCNFLAGNFSIDISQLCYNLHLKRTHYSFRLAIIATSAFDLYNALCQVKENFHGSSDIVFSNVSNGGNENTIKQDQDFDIHYGCDLKYLAGLYISKQPIDWPKYEIQRSFLYLDMPGYSWQHKKYWPSFPAAQEVYSKNFSSIGLYPLLGKIISSPLKQHQFEFELSPQYLPEIRDTHQVVHAGYYLEMLAFVVKEMGYKLVFTVEDLMFSLVLMMPDKVSIKVQLVIEESEEIKYFKFYSQPQENKKWVEHASGKLIINAVLSQKSGFLSTIRQRCSVHHDAKSFDNRLKAMGLPIGDSVSWTNQFWLGQNEVLCELLTPPLKNSADKFYMQVHPGIIDNCLRAQFMSLPEEFDKPFLASNIRKIHYYGMNADKFYLWAYIKHVDFSTGNIISHWSLMNQNGDVLIDCEDALMKQIERRIDIEKMMSVQGLQDIDLSLLPPEEALHKISDYLVEQVANIFSMPKDDIITQESLHKLGMDSLMAMVLMRAIEAGFGITYSLEDVLNGPSIADLRKDIFNRLVPASAHAPFEKGGGRRTPGEAGDFLSLNLPDAQTTQADPLFQKGQDLLSNPWIAYRQPQSAAKIRLFCFPYGGGGANTYREWQKLFPDFIEICPIQLPGREARLNEAPIANIEVLILKLFENLQEYFNLPFAFFGHSFGSLIAFELARYLRRQPLTLPIHLFMSAYPDPKLPTIGLDNLVHQLGDIGQKLFDLNDETAISALNDQEIEKLLLVFNENGLVEYHQHNLDKEVLKMLLPIFVADMSVVKSYHYDEESPLDIPLTVFSGQKDTWVTYNDQLGWNAHTKNGCNIIQLDSGHLFVREHLHRDKIINEIVRSLEKKVANVEIV